MLDIQIRQPRTLEEVISYVRQLEEHLRWALSNIDGETQITEGSVGQKQIAQGAVSSSNLAKGAVTGDALEDGAIAENKLSDAVLADIDKRIKKANSSMLASNEMKDRVNDLIALSDIDWHKIVDDNGQILTAEGEKIRFSRLAIDAGNLKNIGIGQIIIRMEDGLYAITQGENKKLEITADKMTEDGMTEIAETISAETLFAREDMQNAMAEKMPAALLDREDMIEKINALIDAKLGGTEEDV